MAEAVAEAAAVPEEVVPVAEAAAAVVVVAVEVEVVVAQLLTRWARESEPGR